MLTINHNDTPHLVFKVSCSNEWNTNAPSVAVIPVSPDVARLWLARIDRVVAHAKEDETLYSHEFLDSTVKFYKGDYDTDPIIDHDTCDEFQPPVFNDEDEDCWTREDTMVVAAHGIYWTAVTKHTEDQLQTVGIITRQQLEALAQPQEVRS